MMVQAGPPNGLMAFALVYVTFFLDNVLLTVLVPIIPDWIRGESLALWAAHDAPLAKLLNSTVQRVADDDGAGTGAYQAGVGAVLGAKAAVQLLCAPGAAALVSRRGPATSLRLATALLAASALVFAACAGSGAAGAGGAACAGGGRAAHGAGAALAGVAGLATAARAAPRRTHAALGLLLGAVALGVLVGYPFGGAAYLLWSPAAPFQIIAAALLIDLGMQYVFLNAQEYSMVREGECEVSGWAALRAESRRGPVAACAGGVLLTTSVMAALEPCLPLWIMHKFHPQRWARGAVFVPDSAGYLVAASALGGAARRAGAERVALAGLLGVGLAALAVPLASSVREYWHCVCAAVVPDSAGYLVAASALGGAARRAGAERVALAGLLGVGLAALAVPLASSMSQLGVAQFTLGSGLGALDAALVPAVLARAPSLPPAAALMQAAASAAYAIGPALGGALAWGAGFETAMRALGVANLLYAGLLYTVLRDHPLSEQWGAASIDEDSEDGERLPLDRKHRVW